MILGFPLLASQRVQQFYKAWASIYRPKMSPRQVGHPATVVTLLGLPGTHRGPFRIAGRRQRRFVL